MQTSFNTSPSYSFHKSLYYKSFSFFFSFCSVCLPVCLSLKPQRNQRNTPYFVYHTAHQSLSERQNYIHYFGTQTPRKTVTCFGAILYSVGTLPENLHQLFVMMNRLTYFIVRAHIGTDVSPANAGKTRERF